MYNWIKWKITDISNSNAVTKLKRKLFWIHTVTVTATVTITIYMVLVSFVFFFGDPLEWLNPASIAFTWPSFSFSFGYFGKWITRFYYQRMLWPEMSSLIFYYENPWNSSTYKSENIFYFREKPHLCYSFLFKCERIEEKKNHLIHHILKLDRPIFPFFLLGIKI